jgi:riboflavin biosynthesis pyrimidine reductase
MHLPSQQGRVSLPDFLNELAKLGVKSLMVEGGAQVLAAFLRQGLADLLCITLAPRFVGGLNPFVSKGIENSSPGLQEVTYERRGNDLIVYARLAKGKT